MRIIHWVSHFPPDLGGLETLVSQLIAEQVRKGHQVIAIASFGAIKNTPALEIYEGAEIHRFNFLRALEARDLASVVRMRAEVHRLTTAFKPDLHHVHQLGPIGFFADGVVSRRKTPCVVTMHSPFYPQLLREGTLFDRLLRVADRVTAVSEPTLEDLLAVYPNVRARSRVIRNGLPVGRPEFAPVPEGKTPHFVALGRVVPEKGFDVFLEALAFLKEEGVVFTASLAGDGQELDRLMARALHLGLENVLRFRGGLSQDAVWKLYDDATVVVMPSRWAEPFGLVALEAQLAGRPVIASRVGGVPEFVINGETGVLVLHDHPAALATAMRKLAGDPVTAARLAATARERAIKRFSIVRCAAEYEAVYQEAIAVAVPQ